MGSLQAFSQALATLIPTTGSPEFPASLVEALEKMVDFDDATVIAYPGTMLPEIAYSRASEQGGQSTLGTFVKGAFLLDPFYLAASVNDQCGIFRLRDLSPRDFRDSDYYQNWYRNCGYEDECGYLIPLGGEGFVNIALGRSNPGAEFGRGDVSTLEAIYPTLEVLCRQHWSVVGPNADNRNLRGQLHAALDAFGSSLLTDREAQVINMVLHGHSTRTLAEKLTISVETVKLHRKHAYAKLEVSSQAELFFLFLDSLASAGDYTGGDTLESYLRPKPRQP